MKNTLVAATVLLCGQLAAQTGKVPPGFTPIFNGEDLTGWHISEVNHHGATRAWKAEDGVLTGAQDKPGHGGILLTDSKYKDFEVYLEIRPDFGCDGGLFLRSNEKVDSFQGKGKITLYPLAHSLGQSPPFEVLEVIADVGGSEGDPISYHGKCHIFIVEGTFELEFNGEKYTLNEGDSAYYDCLTPHTLRNAGNIKGRLIGVIAPPAFSKKQA